MISAPLRNTSELQESQKWTITGQPDSQTKKNELCLIWLDIGTWKDRTQYLDERFVVGASLTLKKPQGRNVRLNTVSNLSKEKCIGLRMEIKPMAFGLALQRSKPLSYQDPSSNIMNVFSFLLFPALSPFYLNISTKKNQKRILLTTLQRWAKNEAPFCCTNRDCTFLHDNFRTICRFSDTTCCWLNVLQIGCSPLRRWKKKKKNDFSP